MSKYRAEPAHSPCVDGRCWQVVRVEDGGPAGEWVSAYPANDATESEAEVMAWALDAVARGDTLEYTNAAMGPGWHGYYSGPTDGI